MTAVAPFSEMRNPVSGYYAGPGVFWIISWQGFRHAIKHLNIYLYNKVLFVHTYLNKESCLGKGE